MRVLRDRRSSTPCTLPTRYQQKSILDNPVSAALQGAGVSKEAAAAVRVVRDHRSVNAMHSAALEGPERFVAAAAAAQVGWNCV